MGAPGRNYKHWKKIFYPKNTSQNKWLEYYSKHFETVKINYSFYNWPKKSIKKKWNSKNSSEFKIALKAPRIIPHIEILKNIKKELKYPNKIGKELDKKIRRYFFQLLPNYTFNKNNLEKLKKFIDDE